MSKIFYCVMMIFMLAISNVGHSAVFSSDRIRVDIFGGSPFIEGTEDAERKCTLACEALNKSWCNEWVADEDGHKCICCY